MKKSNTLLFFLLLINTADVNAQQDARNRGNGELLTAERKFEILVKNEDDPEKVENITNGIKGVQEKAWRSAKSDEKGVFLDLLKTGYGSALTQKTVNATSNVLSLSISYLTEKFRSHQQDWYKSALQQCTYKKTLKSETKIDDFYAAPSSLGALDPANIKFEGFGCKHYLEVKDKQNNDKMAIGNNQQGDIREENKGQIKGDIAKSKQGKEVFYLFCKLRTDSVGIAHIVNHSKFLVEVDSFMFDPAFCNLPNDSSGSVDSRFDFNKRKDLTFKVTAKIYSSWINEAIMVMKDQLLGEFVITAKIDESKLKDSLFVYNPKDADYNNLVSVSGDCFIVPRSFTGTSNTTNYSQTWGTGQYRIEMDIEENCKINDEYYLIRESGDGKAVSFADGTPGKRKWDKAKWKTEWKAMKARKKGSSFWKNAWESIVTAYKGSGWVETFTDPFTTALYSYETTKLNDWLDLESTETAAGATGNAGVGGAAAASLIGGDVQGATPQAGAMPVAPGQ